MLVCHGISQDRATKIRHSLEVFCLPLAMWAQRPRSRHAFAAERHSVRLGDAVEPIHRLQKRMQIVGRDELRGLGCRIHARQAGANLLRPSGPVVQDAAVQPRQRRRSAVKYDAALDISTRNLQSACSTWCKKRRCKQMPPGSSRRLSPMSAASTWFTVAASRTASARLANGAA
jgi:hypothetical protein